MKKILLSFSVFFILFSNLSKAQCPIFTDATLAAANCFNGNTDCDLCVGDLLTLGAEGFTLPDGGCVDWYFSNNSGFDPYSGGGNYIDCGAITSDDPCTVDIVFEAIMVNANGFPEEANEYIIVNSGGGLDVDDLEVDFYNNTTGPNGDIEPGGCGYQFPNVSLSGCPSAIPVTSGDYIPPNALIVLLTSSAGFSAPFDDFSALCATGAPVYILQSACFRSSGAFKDDPPAPQVRTTTITNSACGFSQTITYDISDVTPADGDYVLGNGGSGNNGTAAPTVNWNPGNPLNSSVDDVNFTIDASLCGGGPYYIKGIINPLNSGCPDEVTITLEFDVICPTAGITGDDDICEGETTTLTATGGTSYSWSSGGGSDEETVMPSSSMNFTVTVYEGNCEADEDFFVTVNPKVPLNLLTADFCESDGIFTLTTLEDPAYPNGTWSGQGVSGVFFDPAGLGGQTISVSFDPDDECGETTFTDITIGVSGFPSLGTETLCASSGIYDLDQLLDPAFPDGTWSGTGVSGSNFDPSGLNGVIDIFFDPDNSCADDGQTEITVQSGAQPVLAADTICQNSGLFDLTLLQDPAFSTGTWSGMGVAGNSFNPSGRSGQILLEFSPSGGCGSSATTFILVESSAAPSLVRDTICQSSGSYDLTQLQDPSFPNGTWFGQGVVGTQLLINNLEGSIALRFDPTELCPSDGNTTLLIYEPITFDSLELTCDSLGGSYQVSFEVTGGDSASVAITGAGTLTGNMFLSDSLMPGDTFQFEISDAGICPLAIVKGEHSCGCTSYAGAMVAVPDTLIFCESETAFGLSDSTFFFDGNDTVMYVLHTGDSVLLGNIVASGGLPEFDYDPTTMSFGTTYFLSTVVGTKDTLGGVDLTDSCVSVAQGIPLEFTNNPQTFWVNDLVICSGDTGVLQLSMNGIADFNYEIFENGSLFSSGTTPQGVVSLDVFPTSNSIYSINTFSDSNCPGVIIDTFANVQVYAPMNLIFTDTIFSGNGTYSVILDISGGDSTNYTFTGASGNWDGDIWTSDPLPCGVSTDVCVSGGVCEEVCFSEIFNCSSPCSTFAGTMLSDTLHLCIGEQAQFSNLGAMPDGDDLLRFYLHTVPGAGLGTVLDVYDIPEFDYFAGLSPETVYYFSAVAGNDDGSGAIDLTDNCLSVAPGTPVIFHDFPDAGFSSDLEVCKDEDVSINVNFTGNAPFQFNYEINNVAYPLGNSATPTTAITNIFNQNGQVVLTQVTDRYCNAANTDTINVNLFPDILIQNVETICDSITQTYVVKFSVAGGLPGTYQVIAGVGILTGNDFEGFPLPSGDTYNYLVLDGNNCDTIPVFGTANCSCATNAGTLQPVSSTQTICGNDQISVTSQGDQVLDGDDLLRYIIHDSPSGLGNIFAENNAGIFTYSNNLIYGTTYYISAIAGSEINPDSIDMNDGCLDISAGIPVIFQPSPTANFSIGTEVCQGDSTVLSFSFNGIPDFRIFYDVIIGGVATRDSLSSTTNSVLTNYAPPAGVSQVVFEPIRVESNGCSSAVSGSQTLNVNSPQINLVDRTLCAGDSIVINSVVYDEDNPTDTILFSRQAQNGCDSLIYIDLNFGTASSTNFDTTICRNDFVMVNNVRYDTLNPTGSETFSLGSCDSIVEVRLTFFQPIVFELRDTFCLSDTLMVNGTVYDQFNRSGVEVLQAANTCDSTVLVNLFFQNQLTGIYRDTLCPGGFVEIGADRYDMTSPTGQTLLQTSSGCDSLVTVELEFRNPMPSTYRDTLCPDGFYELAGERFDELRPSGQVVLKTAFNCDSTVNVALEFYNIPPGTYRDTLCQGGFFELGGERFDELRPSGQTIISSIANCDSIVNVELVFRPTVEASLAGGGPVCLGDSIEVSFNLSNVPMTDFVVTGDNGDVLNFTNSGDGFVFKVAPNQSTTYEITSLDASLNNCPANIVGGGVLVEVSSLTSDVQLSDYQGFNTSCFDNTDGEIMVSGLTGLDPLVISWLDGSSDFDRNNLPSGEYFYTITDAAGCIDSARITLTAPEEIIPEIFAESPSCIEGQKGTISIESIMGGVAPFEMLVDNVAQPNPLVFPLEITDLDSGVYQISVRDANGCETTSAEQIFDAALPMVELGQDTIINLGESIQLTGVASIIPSTISWNPSDNLTCDTCLLTVAAPTSTTTFEITIADASGCEATDVITISVLNESEVFVPGAFSPNNDGINDGFTVFSDSKAVQMKRFYVLDRWGNTLFEGNDLPLNDPSMGWDGKFKGKTMNPGVYVYFAEIEFADGTTKIFKGDVSLM